MKKEVDNIDATPSKRLFLSIIADYDLKKSICELIDNGLDQWVRAGRASAISINLSLDTAQQTITVEDNAGGLAKDELRFVVGPGHTGTQESDETIGLFGVGTKRAVVALAQDIRIKTRRARAKTYEVDFDDNWIADEGWQLPIYEVDDIPNGTTVVALQKLRSPLTESIVDDLRDHLAATYAIFLKHPMVRILLNREPVAPGSFENWAYPPHYSPRRYKGLLKTKDGSSIRVEVLAGLSRESSPATGEYGVYFYCNDRLIARGLKTFEVGFTKGLAGVAHPKVSLTRVLVFLNGDARLMPWNSSKSDISVKDEVFLALHDWLVQVVKDYASLSRNWVGDWPNKVFRYQSGAIEDVEIADFPEANKSFLPPLPKSRPRFAEVIAKKNASTARQRPWTRGLFEGVIAADLISKQPLEQRNRIALIVLDSTLEISFKEYLVNESGVTYNDAKLLGIFGNRQNVHDEIRKYVAIRPAIWKKIDYYYRIRCKFVHERATVGIGDAQLADFRGVVESVLKALYKLKFR